MKEFTAPQQAWNKLFWAYTSFEGTMCKCRFVDCYFAIVLCLMFGDLYCRAVVGEMDEDIDSQLNLANIRAEPLTTIAH